MTEASKAVLKQALQLEPIERAELIEQLLQTFDPTRQGRIDASWAEEVESRINAFEAGKLSADDEDAVFKRINQR